MPDSYTSVLGLIKPEVGASRDTWGAKTNQNWDKLDILVGSSMPIGAILDFAGPFAPSGWLIADGRTISRVTFSDLFAVIGTYWGAGDGFTTFRLPPHNGRAAVGPGAMTDETGASFSFGFTSLQGFVETTITQAKLPNYTISSDFAGYHSHFDATVSGGDHVHAITEAAPHNHGGNAVGGSHTHTGYTDSPGDHTHGYTQATWNTGVWVAGSAGNQLAIIGTQNDPGGNHYHNLIIGNSGGLSFTIYNDGQHSHTMSSAPQHTHAIYGDGQHNHSFSLGGYGQPMRTISPIIVMTKIIFAGPQAVTSLATIDTPAPGAVDEIAQLREEVAQLRALFAPPRQRLLSAPSRGPH